MKLTKRMKNSIIQGSVVNAIFLLILVGIISFILFPRLTDIQDKKDKLVKAYDKLAEISQKGISFGDFKSSIRNSDASKDSYTLNLMKNVTQEFYVDNFTNTGSIEYSSFLQALEDTINQEKKSAEYIEKDQTLSTILPIYDDKNIFSNEGLSDFFFTNYIENILYSFNLSSKGEIGIGNLEKQGGGDAGKKTDSLEEDIYSIPLTLDIVGQKSDVVDFIHYFENVGGIFITDENFEIHKDDFISKRLEGSERQADYNIYKNQIADISSLSLPSYPDSSSLATEGLIEAMKGDQSREKINIEIELLFYVAGVPGYKMEKYVEDFLMLYENLSSKITADAVKYTNIAYKYHDGDSLLSISNIQSLSHVMGALQEDVIKLREDLGKREDIAKTYQQTIIYSQQLSKIHASYNKQLNILTQ